VSSSPLVVSAAHARRLTLGLTGLATPPRRRLNVDGLLALIEDRADLFEHWTHDASVIPTVFYPYWKHRFARDRQATTERFHRWHGKGFEADIERVLDHIGANGAVMSRELAGERLPGAARGWWEWHDGKIALEYLWHSGRLAIAKRDGFQKVYDLAERVIPEAVRAADVAPADYVNWACGAALDLRHAG
jgi:uncharacterized protein YcaQ